MENCPVHFLANLRVNAEDEKAILNSDVAARDQLFQNGAVIIHGNGAVQNKQAFLDSIRRGNLRFLKYARSQIVIHIAGCTTWITALTDKLQAHSSATIQARALMILFIKTAKWKIALCQKY